MSYCNVNVDWKPGLEPNPCRAPDVTHTVVIGCEHEHVVTYRTCAPCRERLLDHGLGEGRPGDRWYCTHCDHQCGLLVRWDALPALAGVAS